MKARKFRRAFWFSNAVYLACGSLAVHYYGWPIILILLLFGWALRLEDEIR